MILRLRHFNPDLKGWEEKDAPLAIPLSRLGPAEAVFGGLSYRRVNEDTLRIHIEMRQKDGSVEHEEHDYYRVGPE